MKDENGFQTSRGLGVKLGLYAEVGRWRRMGSNFPCGHMGFAACVRFRPSKVGMARLLGQMCDSDSDCDGDTKQ